MGMRESMRCSTSDDGLVPVVVEAGLDPLRTRVTMGGLLAGYSGKTFEAYALDLRQWSQWCLDHDLGRPVSGNSSHRCGRWRCSDRLQRRSVSGFTVPRYPDDPEI
jgi:hypothetical protein